MGLLLDLEQFLTAKDISKVKLTEIEQKVFSKPIPCIAMFSMTTEQQSCLIDQILAANPSDEEIEDHLAHALSVADQHTRILLTSMQHSGRKRKALEELTAYLPIHKQISQHSFTALKVLKKELLTLHTTGKPPQGYSLTNTPNLLQYFTHLYRYKASIHPVTFPELENIYLKHHNIHVDDFVEPVYLSNQSPLASDSLPFFDPLSAITKAA